MKICTFLFALLVTCLFTSSSVSAQTTRPLLTAYYGVKDALVATDAAKAQKNAAELLKQTNAVKLEGLSVAAKKSLTDLKAEVGRLGKTTEVSAQRKHFEAVSKDMIALLKATGPAKAYVQFCPMAKASWLSNKKEIANPYYGSQMLTCGKVTEEI